MDLFKFQTSPIHTRRTPGAGVATGVFQDRYPSIDDFPDPEMLIPGNVKVFGTISNSNYSTLIPVADPYNRDE